MLRIPIHPLKQLRWRVLDKNGFVLVSIKRCWVLLIHSTAPSGLIIQFTPRLASGNEQNQGLKSSSKFHAVLFFVFLAKKIKIINWKFQFQNRLTNGQWSMTMYNYSFTCLLFFGSKLRVYKTTKQTQWQVTPVMSLFFLCTFLLWFFLSFSTIFFPRDAIMS